MVGSTISHYRILSKLGEGGMGVVYKAEDTSLDRPVALKFLAAHLVADEAVRKRFEREAKAAAALNHPNICTVYEIAEANGRTFIAMAFLEGEGLDKKIEAGPLKLKDALDIAIQTAKGLQAAHGKSIVHRDIKPANLMLGPDGHVTIMDFGLAQLADRSKLTRMDETMGTVTYMSPEQTYGAEIDHRSDVWSLGVVIYQMVTGQQPFKGHYDKAVMYSITNEQPEPMTALRTGVPMELELLVNKCLAKDADRRYQSTADMVVDLDTLSDKLKSGKSTILTAQAVGQTVTPQRVAPAVAAGKAPSPAVASAEMEAPAPLRRRLWRERIVFGTALLVLAVVILALSLRSPETLQPNRPVRFAFTPGTDVTDPVISPNGRHIAYIAGDEETKLWVQDLDQQEPRELVAASSTGFSLFWSPDSDFIGFMVGGELKKISARGGPATPLCRLPALNLYGGAWSPDRDTIVFAVGGPPSLYKVASAGGTPELLIKGRMNEAAPMTPNFLPREHGKRLLLVADLVRGVVLYNLDTGEEEILFGGLREGLFYSASGHVLTQRGMQGPSSRVWAMPVSTDKLTRNGEPFLVAESASYPSVSVDGTLVYLDQEGRDWQLVWRDRSGDRVGLIGQSQPFIGDPELSPDGRRVAVTAWDADSWNLWVHDVDRPLKTRLTFEELFGGSSPLWSPSGSQIFFFEAVDKEDRGIFSIPADGSGKARALIPSYPGGWPLDWSPDEKYLLVNVTGSNQAGDIDYLKRKDDNSSYEVVTFLKDPFDERGARFSPDGRFVAYSSNESGRYEVYVRRFPDGGGKRQVSESGGMQPRWSRNGKELFYFEGDWLVVIPITTSPSLSVGSPRRLFRSAGLSEGFGAHAYDVSADGKRFVIAELVEDAPPPTIRVVQNWVEAFRGGQQ